MIIWLMICKLPVRFLRNPELEELLFGQSESKFPNLAIMTIIIIISAWFLRSKIIYSFFFIHTFKSLWGVNLIPFETLKSRKFPLR